MSYSIGGPPDISVKQLRVTLAFLALACAGIATASMVERSWRLIELQMDNGERDLV